MSSSTPSDAGSGNGEGNEIENPRDTDVLCGRGGAALRHPGNQTYRRLVSLNKGLYITCLKTEKLKISRSIVAAIREQNGRFLERDSNGKWYDIGDKKAIEKTSQALREGQPKLRQKIVEMGGPGTGGMMDTFSNGVYPGANNGGGGGGYDAYGNSSSEVTGIPPQQENVASSVHRLSQQQQQLAAAAAGLQQQQDVAAVAAHRLSQQQQQLAAAAAGLQQQEAVVSHRLSQQQQQLAAAAAGLQQQQDVAAVAAHRLSQQQQHLAAAAAGLQQQQQDMAAVHRMSHQQQMVAAELRMPDGIQRHESGSEMPPPPARPEIHSDLLQRLSLREHHSAADIATSMNSMPQKSHHLRPSLVQRGSGVAMELGVQESTFSLLSDFSSFAGSNTTMTNESMLSMDPSIGKPRAMNRGSGLLDPTPIGTLSENHAGFSHAGPPMETPTKPGIFNTSLDRRKYFAKMKYTRPASGRFPKPMSSSQHSLSDGMPEIHMVDSTMSLFSNVSSVGADSAKMSGASGPGEMGNMAAAAVAAAMQQQQQQQQYSARLPTYTTMSAMEYKSGSAKSIPSELGGILDSRRSLMSGLSRISDASEVNSLFSDLSKKIGNVSTRSMAMSEISGIDTQLRDEEEDEEESIETSGLLMTANSLDHSHSMQQQQQQFDDNRRTPTTPMSSNMDFEI